MSPTLGYLLTVLIVGAVGLGFGLYGLWLKKPQR